MKKVLSILLAGVLMFTSCGATDSPSSSQSIAETSINSISEETKGVTPITFKDISFELPSSYTTSEKDGTLTIITNVRGFAMVVMTADSFDGDFAKAATYAYSMSPSSDLDMQNPEVAQGETEVDGQPAYYYYKGGFVKEHEAIVFSGATAWNHSETMYCIFFVAVAELADMEEANDIYLEIVKTIKND